ncbi:MAG: hypothetical protein LAO23_03600 [Acidobacteriia bacterium]|jgi:hypothetical protein|nr:hypothetical protein [Terriglobia bacterium]
MDPLITNGIDPALLRVLEKRGDAREAAPRRKRPLGPRKTVEEGVEENQPEPDPDTPKHVVDDLA